ncbi:MAG: DUF1211 domain-containing protein [Methanobacteriota archaeon]|nr:MAG: DUF1211 domain-containing protein [Euryarchaeota archaeon]
MSGETPQERETVRMEAFSDGVFAIAMTLLVLDLRDPAIGSGVSLPQGLLGEWPSFFALVTSFITVLIMWMNHHNMFNYIRRIDRRLMFFNGLLLLFVVLTPFTTGLVADHMLSDSAGAAAAIYSGTFLILSIVWNGLWRYSSSGHRLLGSDVTDQQATTITRQYYVAPLFYALALGVSFVSGLASVVIILLVAAFYGITATIGK